MKEMDNIKIRTEKYSSRSGIDYIKVSFFGRNKSERYPKIVSVNIPASDIPEIILALQKAVQTDRSETTQIAEEHRLSIKKVNIKELKETIKVYTCLGQGIREDIKRFEAAYSECSKCLMDLQNSRYYQRKLEEYYKELEKIEDMYNLKIRDFMPIFNAVKEDWACFAGCLSEDLFEPLSASIFNKKMHMSYFVLKYEKLLEKMDGIPDFPLFVDPQNNESKTGEYKLPKEYYKYVEKIDYLMKHLENPAEIDRMSSEELSDICDEWESCTEEVRSIKGYFLSGKEQCIREKGEYQLECDECKSMIEEYEQGVKTLTSNIWSHEKDWYYYRLLQLACPLMEKVRLEEGEFNAQDAVSLCKQIWELLNDFNKESKKYQFRWITHQDEVSIKSQNISIDFVAGEADWPGLYLYTLDNPEKFICITPGRILAV